MMDGPPRMVAWQPGQVGNEAAIPNNYQCRGFGSSSFLSSLLFGLEFVFGMQQTFKTQELAYKIWHRLLLCVVTAPIRFSESR